MSQSGKTFLWRRVGAQNATRVSVAAGRGLALAVLIIALLAGCTPMPVAPVQPLAPAPTAAQGSAPAPTAAQGSAPAPTAAQGSAPAPTAAPAPASAPTAAQGSAQAPAAAPQPQVVEKGVPGEVDKGVTGEVDKGVTGEVDKGVPGEVDKGVTGEVDKGVTGEVEKGVPGEVDKEAGCCKYTNGTCAEGLGRQTCLSAANHVGWSPGPCPPAPDCIPEPATVLLVVSGFGAAGFYLRRRRAR